MHPKYNYSVTPKNFFNMNYLEILKETFTAFSWVDLLRFLGVYAFGIASGMSFKFAIYDIKAQIPFVAIAMFLLSTMFFIFAIIVGEPFFTHEREFVSVSAILIFFCFLYFGYKGITTPTKKEKQSDKSEA